MRYFHRSVTGPAAVDILKGDGRDGAFLTRPSSRGDVGHNYAISVLWRNDVFHVAVTNSGDFYEILGLAEKFASLTDLIEHCIATPDLFSGDAHLRLPPALRLLHPLASDDFNNIRKEKWMHEKMTQRSDAEEAILRNGVPGSYLVRPSKSQPENFVFTIMTTDSKIVHVPIKMDKEKRFSLDGGAHKYDDLRSLVSKCAEESRIVTSLGDIALKFPVSRTTFPASDVQRVVAALSKADVHTQFEDLAFAGSQANAFTFLAASKAENKPKNRYRNILPYDHTRVVLKDHTYDYINASHVQPLTGNPYRDLDLDSRAPPHRCYIAAQGSLQKIEFDFWKMIIQEHMKVIVMLTREKEGEKMKCSRYWSDKLPKYLTNGKTQIIVTLKEAKKLKNYVIREMEWIEEPLRNSDDELGDGHQDHEKENKTNGAAAAAATAAAATAAEATTAAVTAAAVTAAATDARSSTVPSRPSHPSRPSRPSRPQGTATPSRGTVWHYHFTSWPDAGVPRDPATILDYLWDARLKQEMLAPDVGPMLVHCSAGIGRTGTFIALDCLMNALRDAGPNAFVDVHRLVQLLREQRFGMIQTAEQYEFVYRALAVHVQAAAIRKAAYDEGEENNYENIKMG